MDKILFIGALNYNGIAKCGETIKNKILLERLNELSPNVKYIDTYNWKSRLWILLKLLLIPMTKYKIVISTSTFSAYKLIKFLYLFAPQKDVFYFVIGGAFHRYVQQGRVKLKYYKRLNAIIVEGDRMKNALISEDSNLPVYVIPNFKQIIKIPSVLKTEKRFVFLSRINKEKGVIEIISAVKQILNRGCNIPFSVDFYGRIDKEFESDYFELVNSLPNINYKGFLNLNEVNGYNVLSQYSMMLFPTYWPGEGFPGVIVDSFIAGVPAIVSKWGLNEDIVSDKITGLHINAHDVDDLVSKMLLVITDEIDVNQMSRNCKSESFKYDVSSVLSQRKLKEIGIV